MIDSADIHHPYICGYRIHGGSSDELSDVDHAHYFSHPDVMYWANRTLKPRFDDSKANEEHTEDHGDGYNAEKESLAFHVSLLFFTNLHFR